MTSAGPEAGSETGGKMGVKLKGGGGEEKSHPGSLSSF